MSSSYKSNLVTQADIEEMEKVLASIKLQEEEIALAEQAGIDVAILKQQTADNKARVQKFLAVYKKRVN